MNKKTRILLVALASTLLIINIVSAVDVQDAQRGAIGSNTTKTQAADDSIVAHGGNITNFDINIEKSTIFWTGFFGSVTHNIVLEGGTDNFYDWGTQASTGTILLSNSTSVSWASIGATITSDAEKEDNFLSIGSQPDNVTATFNETNSAPLVLDTTINYATALSANTSSNGGTAWETVLLTDGANAVYATPIQQDNNNYAGVATDFQTMVPVDAGSSYARTYYIYAAIN